MLKRRRFETDGQDALEMVYEMNQPYWCTEVKQHSHYSCISCGDFVFCSITKGSPRDCVTGHTSPKDGRFTFFCSHYEVDKRTKKNKKQKIQDDEIRRNADASTKIDLLNNNKHNNNNEKKISDETGEDLFKNKNMFLDRDASYFLSELEDGSIHNRFRKSSVAILDIERIVRNLVSKKNQQSYRARCEVAMKKMIKEEQEEEKVSRSSSSSSSQLSWRDSENVRERAMLHEQSHEYEDDVREGFLKRSDNTVIKHKLVLGNIRSKMSEFYAKVEDVRASGEVIMRLQEAYVYKLTKTRDEQEYGTGKGARRALGTITSYLGWALNPRILSPTVYTALPLSYAKIGTVAEFISGMN